MCFHSVSGIGWFIFLLLPQEFSFSQKILLHKKYLSCSSKISVFALLVIFVNNKYIFENNANFLIIFLSAHFRYNSEVFFVDPDPHLFKNCMWIHNTALLNSIFDL